MSTRSKTDLSRDSQRLSALASAIVSADAIVIGAGAGLSASAGLTFGGKEFEVQFEDFIQEYHFTDLYSGGFYPFETLEEKWAFWSRNIYYNRFDNSQREVYLTLRQLIAGKDYFIITTNVDHQFQIHQFDKQRLFYTQGDMGLWQCSVPCCQTTYENEVSVRKMVALQYGRKIPTDLTPHCPHCGAPMEMNLRCDNTFVQDAGWYQAEERYHAFLERYKGKFILYLELGVGWKTPSIIKYPFWQQTSQNLHAVYACINQKQIFCPKELFPRSITIEDDIGRCLNSLLAIVKQVTSHKLG